VAGKKFSSTKKEMERSTHMQTERAWNGLYAAAAAAAADDDDTQEIGQTSGVASHRKCPQF